MPRIQDGVEERTRNESQEKEELEGKKLNIQERIENKYYYLFVSS